jgi:hypothetical protein
MARRHHPAGPFGPNHRAPATHQGQADRQVHADERENTARHAIVQGGVHAAEIRSGQSAGTSVLACEVADSTGELTAVFLGRAHIARQGQHRRRRAADDDQPRLRAAALARTGPI